VARGRTYELAFRIGGKLAASFNTATGTASKRLSTLQRQHAALARRQQGLKRINALGGGIYRMGRIAAVAGVAIVGAATAAGAALYRVANATAAVGDRAIKMSQNLGIGVEVLQELWYAAERSGASQEDLNLALRQMQVQLGQAVAGTGEARRYLDQLGLSAQDLARMRPEQAFEALAEAIGKLPTTAEKAAVSQSLFGRGAKKLGVLLDQGANGMRRLRKEARATGAVLSEKAAKDSAKFNDRLLDLKLTFAGLRNIVGSALLPVFTDLFTRLAGWLRKNGAWLRALSARFAELAKKAIPRIVKGVAAFVKQDLPGILRDAWEMARDLWGWLKKTWRSVDRMAKALGGWPSALRKIAAAFVAIKALQFGRAVWDIAAGSLAATRQMGLMASVKMAALAGGVLAIGWALLDVQQYASGADSALGRFLDRHPTGREEGYWGAVADQMREVLDFWGLISEEDRKRMQEIEGRRRLIDTSGLMVQVDDFFLRFTYRLSELPGLAAVAMQAAFNPVQAILQGMGALVWAGMEPSLSRLEGRVNRGMDRVAEAMAARPPLIFDAIGAAVDWVTDKVNLLIAAIGRIPSALAPLDAAVRAAGMAIPGLSLIYGDEPEAGGPGPQAPTGRNLSASSAVLSQQLAANRPERGAQSAPITLNFAPAITMNGSGGAEADAMAAVKAGADDLLERLQAAQEKQNRLAYG